MNGSTTLDRPHEGLLHWLVSHHVDHDVHKHDEAFTAQSTARAEGVDPRTFAKVVGVATDDGRSALLVVDAPDHLDLGKARDVLGAREVRLLSEGEMAALAPGCAPGAMPAVGSLFGLPMHADYAVRDDAAISFNAGSHRFSVRVDRAGWERASGVHYADLAAESDTRPMWARS
jgi:Ala-tRNA(Pro) deacylase